MSQVHTVILFLRSNVDWSKLNEGNFLEQNTLCPAAYPTTAKQRELLLSGIRVWNSVLGMSYFCYRQRLREISNRNWCRLRNLDLVLINHNHYQSLLDWSEAYVVPVDEDDWFRPDLADLLRSVPTADVDIVRWKDAAFRPIPQLSDQDDLRGTRPRIRLRASPEGVPTNSYAVSTRLLARLPLDVGKSCLMKHWEVDRYIVAHSASVHSMPEYVGVTHKSLASWTNIKSVRSTDFLLEQLDRLTLQTHSFPNEVAWAQEYVSLSEELNQHLYASRRQPR